MASKSTISTCQHISTSPHLGLEEMTIATLIDHNRQCWRNEVIEQLFNTTDMLSTNSFGSLLTHGEYSIQTAYHHLMETMICNNALKVRGNWTQIWNLNIPPKVKHFLWRLQRNILPTRQRLQSKGVNSEQLCCNCNSNFENDFHLFFGCHQVKGVWEEAELWSKIKGKVYHAEKSTDLVFDSLEVLHEIDKENLALTLWCMWRTRNEQIWDNVDPLPRIPFSLARQFFHEWRFARRPPVTADASHHQTVHTWEKPSMDFIKANKILCLPGSPQPIEAEALGLYQPLQWTTKIQLDKVICELDCKQMAEDF